jgi:hypothetical protein
MRTARARLGVAVSVAMAAWAIYLVLPAKVSQLLIEESVSAEIARSRSSTAFVLNGRGWTDFNLPPEQAMVKVVSNGNVPESLYAVQDLLCEYTLRLDVLDSSGVVLKTQESVLRSSPLNYRDEETGAILPAQTYLGVPLLPLSSRTSIINIEGLEGAARRLRLSLARSDPRVRDVNVRVYVNQKPAAYKLRYMWQRMPLEKRERLARANVHGLDFLTDTEKERLLENRWVAVAPLGFEGSGYFERRLYTLKERYNAILSGAILPRGVYVAPGTLGTVPVPEDGGCVRLEFQRVPGSAREPSVHLVWYRRGGLKPVETDLHLADGAMSYSSECDGGLLEIEASDEIVARAYLDGVANGIEITPETKCAQCYRARGGAPVEFSIVSDSDSPSAFRLDVRRVPLGEGDDPPREISLAYELLDSKRNVLGVGRFAHAEADSWYDKMTGTVKVVAVSDPSRHYFCLPVTCAFFRVFADSDAACVTAYTRPFGLVRQVKVPGDYLAFERAQDDARTWFPLRPERYTDCVASECEVFVKTQQRPPGAPDEALAGGWHVDSCEPEGAVNAIKLLTPVEPDGTDTREASPAYFAELAIGETRDLYLGDASGVPVVAPRLIWLKSDDSAGKLTLYVDGALHFQSTQASRVNDEVVPPIDEGWRSIRVEAPRGARVYMNSLLVQPEAIVLERAAHSLATEGLKYRVYKETPGRETLAMRLYAPTSQKAQTIVSASVSGVPKAEGIPSDSWTFLEAVYEIRAPEAGTIPALGFDGGDLSGGELFLLALGADLRQGWYDVTLRLDAGPRSFLSVLHIVPGTREVRRVSSEINYITGDLEQ